MPHLSVSPTAAAFSTIVALSACAGDKGDPTGGTDSPEETGTPDAGPVWEEAFAYDGPGALSGVWGTGPNDVFMVGGTDAQGEIYHFDGTAWSAMDVPSGVPLMVWVHGFAPDDVWAVGYDGVALHWDGSEWSSVATGTTEPLWGVFGLASSDLWVVGGLADVGEPVILHWDGSGFTPHPMLPEENERGATTMFKIWGHDASSLFMVGQKGQINVFDGAEWRYSGAGPEADQDFVSLWGTAPDHIVAVGGRGNARVAVWDGAAWTTHQPSGVGGLNGVTLLDPDTAIVGGINGYVGRFDVATATLTAEAAPTAIDVHALWYDGAGKTYGVAGRFLAPYGGAALVRTE